MFTIGSEIPQHANFNFDSNCILCAKPLGKKFSEVMVDDRNNLITAAQYDDLYNQGAFVTTVPVGSTCINKIAKEAVA